jgi:hypothetical protein
MTTAKKIRTTRVRERDHESVTVVIVQRAVLMVACGLIVLGTGCDRLFSIQHVDPDAPAPTTDLVQQQTAADPNEWMISATLPALPTNGNLLVVIGATDRYNLASPSGGGVATWTLAALSSTHANVEIWYGVSDGSSATVTINCGCPTTTLGNMRLSVSEWQGLAASNAAEVGSDAAGSSKPGAATIPAITTLDRPDLLIFGVSVVGTIAADAAGSGTWTALDPITVAPVIQSHWYQLVAEPGSYAASVMVNGDWDAAIAAFRALP